MDIFLEFNMSFHPPPAFSSEKLMFLLKNGEPLLWFLNSIFHKQTIPHPTLFYKIIIPGLKNKNLPRILSCRWLRRGWDGWRWRVPAVQPAPRGSRLRKDCTRKYVSFIEEEKTRPLRKRSNSTQNVPPFQESRVFKVRLCLRRVKKV